MREARCKRLKRFGRHLRLFTPALTDDRKARFNTMGAQTMVVPYKREKRLAVNIAKLPLTYASAVGLRNDGIFRPLPSFVAKLRASIF